MFSKINNEWQFNYTYYEGIDNDGDGLVNEDMIGFVDLNRNYNSFFRNGLSWEDDTQSEIYPGETAFSEPETQAFRDFALKHKFSFSYSLHSGINATLFPTDRNGNWVESELFWQVANEMIDVLPPSFNDIYFGTKLISHVPAATAGVWDNWMYDLGTKIPITLEIFNAKTSTSLQQYFILEENSTTQIWQFDDIFGFFNPRTEDIDSLFTELIPAFTYLFDNTAQINVKVDDYSYNGRDLEIKFDITNLSHLLSTQNSIYASNGMTIANGKLINPLENLDISFRFEDTN